MSDRVMLLGGGGHMVGIASVPELADSTPAPVVLLLNAGLIHRVGPNRMNVALARDLADRGFMSVRFDMSGIGDSDRPEVERPYVEQTVADITEVMDHLEAESGASQFVLVGLCTGAYNALAAAGDDPRVVGCALIDGYAYPTSRYRVTNQLRKIAQLWRWRRYIKRRLGLGPEAKPASDDVLVFQPEDLDQDEFGRRIDVITKRGARVHFAYTGFGPQPYNYEKQLFTVFPEFDRERVSVIYLPHANHTFTLPVPRRMLIDSILDWMEAGFGTPEKARKAG